MIERSWMRLLASLSDNRKSKIQNRNLVGIVALVLTFVMCGVVAEAQQKKIPRIGVLFIGSKNQPHLEAFKQGLRERGYTEGKNILFEYRYAEGNNDRLPQLAAELVSDKVDVIVTTASVSAIAARRVTKTIPIVMTSGNPLESGLAASLAKPGGNVTGLTVLSVDLSGKRVELLTETFPKTTRIAALQSPQDFEAGAGYKETQEAAKAFSLRLHPVEVQSANDFEPAFAQMNKAGETALLVILSPMITFNSRRIVELALKYRLPGMYPTKQFAEEGGLMSYGPLIGDLYRRAATYVDKILKGANPGELPVEQPTKFELVINLKTAKQIGVTIPANVLARADRVIK
ncbi:MAG TPA: ABC transporter substrate-binding protein [Candidatus Binatia bacterium]|nr:ABC transporter substrate-binding protein [Candidatus Binatia bacterium]